MNTPIKFKDIASNFSPNVNTGDLTTVSNEKSIAQSLKTLVNYNFYDIPFQPRLGSNIRSKLFDLVSDITSESIKTDLKLLIENFEPRVEVIDIKSSVSSDKHGIDVALTYRARTSTSEIVVNYFLTRII